MCRSALLLLASGYEHSVRAFGVVFCRHDESARQGLVMEFVQAGEVRLAVERHGSGEPVVLVAGIGAGREMWLPSQISALTGAGFEVVRFNNRGVPPSDVPSPPYSIHAMAADTAALIGALDLPAVSVVGFSLGALIAQELALAHPRFVRAVVLVGSLGRKDLTRRRLGEHAAEELTTPERRFFATCEP
jgi:pimeloyl-ACP methyl ester carboxylesterase